MKKSDDGDTEAIMNSPHPKGDKTSYNFRICKSRLHDSPVSNV